MLWRISGSKAQGEFTAVTCQHIAGCFILFPLCFSKKAAWFIDGKKRHHGTAPSYTYDSGRGWVEVVFREYADDFISESTRRMRNVMPGQKRNEMSGTLMNYRRILPLLVLTCGTASGRAYARSLALDVAQGFRSR
jgi:hypothetical protein